MVQDSEEPVPAGVAQPVQQSVQPHLLQQWKLHERVTLVVTSNEAIQNESILGLCLHVQLEPKSQQANNVKAQPFASLRHVHWLSSRDGRKQVLDECVNLRRHCRLEHANGSVGDSFADDLALRSVQCLVDTVEDMWI